MRSYVKAASAILSKYFKNALSLVFYFTFDESPISVSFFVLPIKVFCPWDENHYFNMSTILRAK